mgnify:FL=1
MKREKEAQTVACMIEIYCRGHHGKGKQLCPECKELLDYANYRLSKCPHGDNKPFCSNCKIHCYKPDMKEKIRLVMRYSGPRMIFHHPIIAVRHLIQMRREKGRNANA